MNIANFKHVLAYSMRASAHVLMPNVDMKISYANTFHPKKIYT